MVDETFTRILATWQRRQNDYPEAVRAPARRPLFHISEQFYDPAAARLSRIGKHSECINDIPMWFLNLLKREEISVDIEVEATGNERAILKLYGLYPQIFGSSPSQTARTETPTAGARDDPSSPSQRSSEPLKTTPPRGARLRIRDSTQPVPKVTGDVRNFEGVVDLDDSSQQALTSGAEAKVDDGDENQ